ncbi:MAG TPA: tetratricopeptide repeat protein [Gemmataceae bacterium]|nr:tetratricopeptide repeat protein [Gemmataceae bacterium]
MATSADLFALALRHHQAGDLTRAEALYRQLLQADPGHADSLHLLGVLAYQTGHAAPAAALIRDAIARAPGAAVYHSNLGVVLQALGRPDEAAASYEQALRLEPACVDAHVGLGNLLTGLGRPEQAARHCEEALRLRPGSPEAHNNLANALLRLGRKEAAAAHYREALRLRPDYAEAHSNLGVALADLGRLEEAAGHHREALRLNPNYPEGHNNLGNVLRDQWKLDEAIASFREAVRLRPDYAEAHNNMGTAVRHRGKLEQAVACYRRALELRPDYAEARNNLGNALKDQGQLDEAAACFEEALRLRPDYAEAHWNRSLLWLLRGELGRGWPEYEWRWTQPGFAPRPFAQPRWDGSPLAGRVILLWAEQGLGDTLHFIRYAPLVKERGGRVIVECQPALRRLLAGAVGVDQLVAQGEPLPPFDVQAPLLSLPGIFGTSLDAVPASVPYLQADAGRVEYWRQKLAGLSGLKVGIAWQGNPAFRGDRQRSVPLAHFAPPAAAEGVRLISLQKGPGAEQLTALGGRFPVTDLGDELDEAAGPFVDTAAVMKNLDLVISSDTAVPHLAGALGVPVWVALPLVPDWRWLLGREDCPWYPTMRLFRQTRPDDWDEVFARVAAELRALVAGQGR